VEAAGNEKHTVLQEFSINYDRKKFYDTGQFHLVVAWQALMKSLCDRPDACSEKPYG
jgi:hypothetical protein